MDFINRSVGTPLETEYDLLVNLFLIKKKGRKVCLVESCGLSLKNSNLTYKKYYELIKSIYPEFVYKINDYGKSNSNIKNIPKANNDLYYATFFVSLSKIEEYESKKETYDSYLGRILGFDEHGIPNSKKIRYSLRYSVVIQEQSKYNFYCGGSVETRFMNNMSARKQFIIISFGICLCLLVILFVNVCFKFVGKNMK